MWLCWRRSVPAPGQHFSVFRVPHRDLGQVVAALIGTLPLVSLASVSVREGECGLAPSDGLVTVLCLVPVPRACAEWGLLSVGPRRVSGWCCQLCSGWRRSEPVLGAQCSYSLKALILFWESHPQLFLFLVLGTGGERMSWVCLCGVVSRQRPQPGACVSFLSPPATTLYLTRGLGVLPGQKQASAGCQGTFPSGQHTQTRVDQTPSPGTPGTVDSGPHEVMLCLGLVSPGASCGSHQALHQA